MGSAKTQKGSLVKRLYSLDGVRKCKSLPSQAPYLGSPDRRHFQTVADAWETSLLSFSNSVFAKVNCERPHSKHTESLGNTKRAGLLRFSLPEKWMQISESSSDSLVDPHFSHIFKSLSRTHSRAKNPEVLKRRHLDKSIQAFARKTRKSGCYSKG